jgi:integrase
MSWASILLPKALLLNYSCLLDRNYTAYFRGVDSLLVQRTVYEIKKAIHIGEPKTAKGRRRVDLPVIAIEALQAHRRQMFAEGRMATWVFCNRNGGLAQRHNFLKREFRPLLEQAELPLIRFHDLRHTAATLLLSQGVHPKVVQERLGHAQVGITLDTYSHVLPSLQKETAARLDLMFAEIR